MRALLANDGTLMGYSDAPVEQITGLSVEVPEGCDLIPGKYRWDDTNKRFEPIMVEFKRPTVKGDPDALIAIALGFRALEQRGYRFPAYTTEWLRTFDRYPDTLKRVEK